MNSASDSSPRSLADALRSSGKEIVQPFIDLVHVSRALWAINLSYMLEGITYFGVLGLMAIFFNQYIGLDDIQADVMVAIQSAGITLAMLLLGATVDFVGPRKALLLSLALMSVGRVLLAVSPGVDAARGMWTMAHVAALGGIFWIVLGYGMYQPAAYAAKSARGRSPATAATKAYSRRSGSSACRGSGASAPTGPGRAPGCG